MTDDLAALDATAQAELVRRGTASPAELVEAAIARVEAVNPHLNAVIHPRFERARVEAGAGLPDGPFRGVPILFKDLLCALEGEPYHEGMRYLRDAGWRSTRTDDLARRYLDAGFVCVGRTNAPELGIVPTTEPQAYGPTRNPWDTDRTPGGSSGGSAAAVASGMVPVAHANDGGGSIRIPASACGLVGLKPSRGRTPLGPHLGVLSNVLVTELGVTRSVRDTAALLDVAAGAGPGERPSPAPPSRPFAAEVGADPGRLHVGLLTDDPYGTGPVHPDCIAAAERTARLLESAGHTVDAEHPRAIMDEALVGHFATLWSTQVAWDLADWQAQVGREMGPDDVEPLTWSLGELGRATTAVQYLDAVHALQRLGREVDHWWASGFDLLLTPTLGEPPVPLGTFDASPDEPFAGFLRAAAFVPFTPTWNVTGQPAISLPLHWNDAGLPIGSQLVAAGGREDLLLRVAAQLEQAAPWADRRPPVHASALNRV